jgi:hypothetical protein
MKLKMNSKFKLFILFLVLTLFNCKPENNFSDFKFTDKGSLVECENDYLKALINEAVFSFEDDISNFYGKEQANIILSYSQFVRNAISDRVIYSDVVSPHTLKVFEALKKENTFWNAESTKSHLNYESPFFKCISNKIQDQNLKTTLNALISTKSMSPKLFGSPLLSNYHRAASDKHLAAYIAFDLYYAKLFNIDLSGVEEKPEPKVDFNQIPK